MTASCRLANAWLIATYWPWSHRSLASTVVMRKEKEDDMEPESDVRVVSAAAGITIDTLMCYFEQNELSTADDIHQLSIV